MKKEIVYYHGTDWGAAQKIQAEGFSFRPNKEHWLGNGIYFFLDRSLAKWWTKKPSAKFGTHIAKPVVLRCSIEIDTDDLMDIRDLEDYMDFCKIYKSIYFPQYIEKVKNRHPSDTFINYKQIRCQYCDFLKIYKGLKAITGNFYLPNQPYLPQNTTTIIKHFQIAYTEIQLCVFDPSLIKIEEIVKLV